MVAGFPDFGLEVVEVGGEASEDWGEVVGHGGVSLSWSCWSRFAASWVYSGSISRPMAVRPRFRAARSVAPDPAKGSMIVQSGGQCWMSHSMSSTGFGVGCLGRCLLPDG